MRKFRFNQGTSDKLWGIHVEGSSTVVEFGRAGSNLRTVKKKFKTPAAAQAAMDKLIDEKLEKEYVEIRLTAPKGNKAKPRAQAKSSAKTKTAAKAAGKSTKKTKASPSPKKSARRGVARPKLSPKVERILDQKFPSYAELIRENCLASVVLQLKPGNDRSIRFGSTKVGGRPDLPKGYAWPTLRVKVPPPSAKCQKKTTYGDRVPGDEPIHYSFMAQVNLKEVARFDSAGLLPERGLLSFFFCNRVWYSDGKRRPGDWEPLSLKSNGASAYIPRGDACHVLYFPDASKLVRATPPYDDDGDYDDDVVRATYRVKLSSELTLPQTETPHVTHSHLAIGEPVRLESEDHEEYQEFTWAMNRRGKVTQMLGHPDQVQPGLLEHGFSEVRKVLFPEFKKPLPFNDPFQDR
jgi:predicted DNA-binding WGR domain protein